MNDIRARLKKIKEQEEEEKTTLPISQDKMKEMQEGLEEQKKDPLKKFRENFKNLFKYK